MIEIDERVGGPDLLAKLFAGHDLSGTFQQNGENLEGLLLKPDAGAILAQLAGVEVHFENAKSHRPGLAIGGHRHEFTPAQGALRRLC